MKSNEQSTLETDLKELMRLVRKINVLEHKIDEKYGVRMVAGYIPGLIDNASGEINVRRGMEEIEKALGKEAHIERYLSNTKFLRHQGIEFRQYADDKTKTFVKAFGKPPKVKIVEDSEE